MSQESGHPVVAGGVGRDLYHHQVVRGGPGSLMFVPAGCPHAFTNPGTVPARMLFLVAPSGHEQYLEGVAELLSRPGPPDQSAIADRGARFDIAQLTPMIPARRR